MASTLSPDTYDIGDRVRLSIEVRDKETLGEPLIDPDGLQFQMRAPDNTVTTWQYGQDDEVVRDDLGLYHVHWDAAQVGTHWSRFFVSGNVGGAEERGFKVRSSKVLPP